MKIQCDVCNKDEASVFCVADEAALCHGCDHSVHHANKLAWKHQRFSLLKPSSNEFSMCDICQEKRAFLFCQQDRAILCKNCDIAIHKVNEHTKKHNRFLLTGVKLSPVSNIYLSPLESDLVPDFNKSKTSAENHISIHHKIKNPISIPHKISGPSSVPEKDLVPPESELVPDFNKLENPISIHHKIKNPISIPHKISGPYSVPEKVRCSTIGEKIPENSSNKVVNPQQTNINGGCNNGLTSSISEYLMENIPGWHVDDFLDSSISVPNSLFKNGENDVTPFWDDLQGNLESFPSANTGIWVPQPPIPNQLQSKLSNLDFSSQIYLEKPKQLGPPKAKTSGKWRDDGNFVVPEISPSFNSMVSKRSRTLW